MKKLKVVCMVLLTTLWICGCEEKVGVNLKEQLELGQRYLQEMDYENAIIAFQKMIEIDPKAWKHMSGWL